MISRSRSPFALKGTSKTFLGYSYSYGDIVMSCLDTCLTRLCGDRVPLETARKTFFFLLGIAIMLLVIALPTPPPFYRGRKPFL